MTENNPYINNTNYYEEYKALENNSPGVQLDELCWHVFNSEDGKKLLEIFKERFVMIPTQGPVNENFPVMCTFYEGFREAFRQIIGSVNSYQIKKDEEAKKAGL